MELWPFPWREPKSHYDTDGPAGEGKGYVLGIKDAQRELRAFCDKNRASPWALEVYHLMQRIGDLSR